MTDGNNLNETISDRLTKSHIEWGTLRNKIVGGRDINIKLRLPPLRFINWGDYYSTAFISFRYRAAEMIQFDNSTQNVFVQSPADFITVK